VAARQRLAQRHSGGKRWRRKKVLHRGGLLPFIAGRGGWKRAAQVAAVGSGGGETGGRGRAAAATVRTWSARAAPLVRQCG
jgi:hypothetical protein